SSASYWEARTNRCTCFNRFSLCCLSTSATGTLCIILLYSGCRNPFKIFIVGSRSSERILCGKFRRQWRNYNREETILTSTRFTAGERIFKRHLGAKKK